MLCNSYTHEPLSLSIINKIFLTRTGRTVNISIRATLTKVLFLCNDSLSSDLKYFSKCPCMVCGVTEKLIRRPTLAAELKRGNREKSVCSKAVPMARITWLKLIGIPFFFLNLLAILPRWVGWLEQPLYGTATKYWSGDLTCLMTAAIL